MLIDQTATTDTFICACTVCGEKAITAPHGYISGTAKQVRDMVHNYVQGAHSAAGIGRIMCDRAGIKAA